MRRGLRSLGLKLTRWVGWLTPRSLRYQLLSRSLLILAALLVGIGAFQYAWMSHFLYMNTARNIRSQVMSPSFQGWLYTSSQAVNHGGVQPPPPFGYTMSNSTAAFIDQQGKFYQIYGDTNERPIIHLPVQAYEAAMTYDQKGAPYQIVTDSTGQQVLVVLTRIGPRDHPIGVIQVTTDVDPLRGVLIQQFVIFICLAGLALVAGLLTFNTAVRRTLDPLASMVNSVLRVDAGNLDERIAVEGKPTEVRQLATSFNTMLERLKVSFDAERAAKERMRKFVADASHELRTPLTSIHGFLEVLLRGAASNPEQLRKALESMHTESERLTKLVQDLLLLARLDQEPTLVLQTESLDAIIRDMKPQLQLLAGERTVSFLITDNVTVRCDKDRIKQVLLNLYQNAVQHTDPKTGKIDVTLTHDDANAYLAVRDNGPGIAPEQRSRIFERFYRMDTARSRKEGGAGLGLPITRSIVEAHGGVVTCDSDLGRGTVFTVRLPLG